MQRYRGRYRILSARWAAWDYASSAAYFVTICTRGRVRSFGQVVGGEMILSPLGQAAAACWEAIPEHFPFIAPDAFIVMPDHVHGIIVINKPDSHGHPISSPDIAAADNAAADGDGDGDRPGAGVEPQDIAALPRGGAHPAPPRPPTRNRFGPQSRNLASVVRGFKTGVTMYAHRNDIVFGWQARYYDIVIRDGVALDRIRRYILANPERWGR